MDDKDYFTIPDISERLKIPENTVRRYIWLFNEFMAKRDFGGIEKYSPNSLEIISEISQLDGKGCDTFDIFEVLSHKRSRIFEVKKEGKQPPLQTTGIFEANKTTPVTVADQTNTLKKISCQMEKLCNIVDEQSGKSANQNRSIRILIEMLAEQLANQNKQTNTLLEKMGHGIEWNTLLAEQVLRNNDHLKRLEDEIRRLTPDTKRSNDFLSELMSSEKEAKRPWWKRIFGLGSRSK